MMYSRITHIEEDDDKLAMNEYIYWLDGTILILDVVRCLNRESRRHKYQTVDLWSRLSHRNSTMARPDVSKKIQEIVFEKARDLIRFEEMK